MKSDFCCVWLRGDSCRNSEIEEGNSFLSSLRGKSGPFPTPWKWVEPPGVGLWSLQVPTQPPGEAASRKVSGDCSLLIFPWWAWESTRQRHLPSFTFDLGLKVGLASPAGTPVLSFSHFLSGGNPRRLKSAGGQPPHQGSMVPWGSRRPSIPFLFPAAVASFVNGRTGTRRTGCAFQF